MSLKTLYKCKYCGLQPQNTTTLHFCLHLFWKLDTFKKFASDIIRTNGFLNSVKVKTELHQSAKKLEEIICLYSKAFPQLFKFILIVIRYGIHNSEYKLCFPTNKKQN